MKTALFVCLSLAALTSFAKTVHVPLPPALMQAKTIHVENDSGDAKMADTCYPVLTEGGASNS